MRLLVIGACLLFAGCSTAERAPEAVAGKPQLGEMAEKAYATGCYRAYIKLCAKLRDDEKRGSCHDQGIAECEPAGRDFRRWIEQNPSAPINP